MAVVLAFLRRTLKLQPLWQSNLASTWSPFDAQRASKRCPEGPKLSPKGAQEASKTPQEASKRPPRPPKRLPRRPRDPPRHPQDTPSTSKRLPGRKAFPRRKDLTQIWYYCFHHLVLLLMRRFFAPLLYHGQRPHLFFLVAWRLSRRL